MPLVEIVDERDRYQCTRRRKRKLVFLAVLYSPAFRVQPFFFSLRFKHKQKVSEYPTAIERLE